MLTHTENENSAVVESLPRSPSPPESPPFPTSPPKVAGMIPIYFFTARKDHRHVPVPTGDGVGAKFMEFITDFTKDLFPGRSSTRFTSLLGEDAQGNRILYGDPSTLSGEAPDVSAKEFEYKEHSYSITAYSTQLTAGEFHLVSISIPQLPLFHLNIESGGNATSAPAFALDIVKGVSGKLISWSRTGPKPGLLYMIGKDQPVGITMTAMVPKTARLVNPSDNLDVRFRTGANVAVCKYCKGFHLRDKCKEAPKCHNCNLNTHPTRMCPHSRAPKAPVSSDGFTTVSSKRTRKAARGAVSPPKVSPAPKLTYWQKLRQAAKRTKAKPKSTQPASVNPATVVTTAKRNPNLLKKTTSKSSTLSLSSPAPTLADEYLSTAPCSTSSSASSRTSLSHSEDEPQTAKEGLHLLPPAATRKSTRLAAAKKGAL